MTLPPGSSPGACAAAPGWTGGPGFILFVAALMAVLSLSLDILLPAFPAMAASYGLADAGESRLTLTVFVLAFGLGHLLHGALADRFGRRPVLGGALVVFAACGVWAALAPGFDQHLAARFVQGLAAAGPRVVAVALLRDTREGPGLVRDMSRVMMIFMLAPILGPVLGQGIMAAGGWRAIPLVLALAALVPLAITWRALPETLPPGARRGLDPGSYGRTLTGLLRTRVTLGNTLAAGMAYGLMFGFIGISPALYQMRFGVGEGFAALFSTVGLGIAAGSWLNARIVTRAGPAPVLRRAAWGLVACGAALAGFGLAPPPLVLFQAVLVAAMVCMGFAFANCSALAIAPHRHVAGQAAALTGAMTISLSAVVAEALGRAYAVSFTLFGAGWLAGAVAVLALVAAANPQPAGPGGRG